MVPTAIAIEKPTYIVQRGSVASQLYKSGRITPAEPYQLRFPREGQIDTLLASKGGTVTAGDIIATLDTAGLERSLQGAESDLNLANEKLALAQERLAADLRRAEIGVELVQLELNFVEVGAGERPTLDQQLDIEKLKLELELAQLDLDEFDSAVDPALSYQVAQNQLQVERLKTQIAQSTLETPISGTVMAVNFEEGDNVKAGETVLVVADLNRVEVELSLYDHELQQLTEGMVAFGNFPSQPETGFAMTVRQLPYPYGTGAQDDESEGSVRISFDDPAQVDELNIGTRVVVAILLERHDDVLWLPPAGIREFNGRLFVVVQEGEAQKRLDVKVGLQNENQIEVLSGVSEGQVVVGP
jgi:multidrug efflux pump subunit AcrA (membrane-fusion protein)